MTGLYIKCPCLLVSYRSRSPSSLFTVISFAFMPSTVGQTSKSRRRAQLFGSRWWSYFAFIWIHATATSVRRMTQNENTTMHSVTSLPPLLLSYTSTISGLFGLFFWIHLKQQQTLNHFQAANIHPDIIPSCSDRSQEHRKQFSHIIT